MLSTTTKILKIFTFIIDMFTWVLFYIPGLIFFPLIYLNAKWIRANYHQHPLASFLWLFLNKGKEGWNGDASGETFEISNRNVAADWYLIREGYSLENKPNKWQSFVVSYKWNALRNYADNYLNEVIGFNCTPRYEIDGTEVIRYDKSSRWFYQIDDNGEKDYRFYWRYESKFIFISLGSLECRYSVHLKFPFLNKDKKY